MVNINQKSGMQKMITKKQLKIFQVFAKQPFAKLERKLIKQLTKEKSTNALTLALNQFLKEGIIKSAKVGKSYLYSLNLNNYLTYHYIALASYQRIEKNVKTTIQITKEELDKVTLFYSLVIFGSYAVQEQNRTSDLDIAIIIEEKNRREKVEIALNAAKQKSLIKIDSHIITKKELIEMLTNEEENLGKQIARKHLVLNNHEIFYKIVKEGIKHGFTI